MGRLFDGAIFDLDGVITDTSRLHEQAWRESLHPFHLSPEQFIKCFDGRSREEGLNAYLIDSDGAANEAWKQTKLERKAEAFDRLLIKGPITVYDDTRRLLDWLKELRIPCAVASSSKTAPRVIEVTGLAKYFRYVSDGTLPKPEVYKAAAAALRVPLADCCIFEDSPHAVSLSIDCGAKYVVYVRKDRK